VRERLLGGRNALQWLLRRHDDERRQLRRLRAGLHDDGESRAARLLEQPMLLFL
jgi:hypothetical protein